MIASLIHLQLHRKIILNTNDYHQLITTFSKFLLKRKSLWLIQFASESCFPSHFSSYLWHIRCTHTLFEEFMCPQKQKIKWGSKSNFLHSTITNVSWKIILIFSNIFHDGLLAFVFFLIVNFYEILRFVKCNTRTQKYFWMFHISAFIQSLSKFLTHTLCPDCRPPLGTTIY